MAVPHQDPRSGGGEQLDSEELSESVPLVLPANDQLGRNAHMVQHTMATVSSDHIAPNGTLVGLDGHGRDSSTLTNQVPTCSELPFKGRHNNNKEEVGSSVPSLCRQPLGSTLSAERNNLAPYPDSRGEWTFRMHRFSLYETASRYYLIGGDITDSRFRVLKIDRTVEDNTLSIAEDEITYTKTEMNQLLNAVDDGNRSTGGLKLKCSTWGLLGFIRFTDAYYMLLITKRSQVAVLGGHYIYQIDGTDLVPLASPSTRLKVDRHPEEARFIGILSNLDLSRSFYFSYSYDVTRTLQHNLIHERQSLQQESKHHTQHDVNKMFVWNHHLLKPAAALIKNTYDWCLPIIHGFIDQASRCRRVLLGAG